MAPVQGRGNGRDAANAVTAAFIQSAVNVILIDSDSRGGGACQRSPVQSSDGHHHGRMLMAVVQHQYT